MKYRLKALANPPIADRIESICSAHGEEWVDHYAWLRADNLDEVIKDPSKLPAPIADYLNAENEYFDKSFAEIKPLHEEIVAEMFARMPLTTDSIPETDGPYKYQQRMAKDAEHAVLVRTDLNGESEEVIFDINVEAGDYEYFDVDELDWSPDHSKLLWSCDTSGAEYYTLYIRDITTGKDRDYVIENVGGVLWGDDQTVFYTRSDSNRRHLQIYKHVLDSNPQDDVLVFSETDKLFGCNLWKSRSRQYIYIQTATFDEDEWWYIPVNDLNVSPVLIQERRDGIEYYVDHQGDRFIIRTNDAAIDWKLVETPINTPSKEHWKDLVPHQAGRVISGYMVLEDWIVWLETVNALPQIAYMDKGGNIKRVEFEEEAYSLSLRGREYKKPLMLLGYTSLTTPTENYEYNLETAERTLVKKQVISGGHDAEDYITRRFDVESHDGAQVPVTLLYRRDLPLNGTAPVFLTGYGNYGSSSPPFFASSRFSLVDRGFIYAIAHVRGGGERGDAWHNDAKLERKVNSFHDFNAVADALVTQKFCAPGKIVSMGGSAGGLLVTASMIMRPDLFAGVIAEVPDVDVLTIMLDETLPGIPEHFSVWGNPAESKSIFEAIRGYSPYENTQAVDYPALYVTAGISDPRVVYWQPAKWVAKLRALKTDDNVVLLKTDMNSGHFGGSGLKAQIHDNAERHAFAITVTSD